jgi:hypothetical protein
VERERRGAGTVWLLDFDGVVNSPRAGWSRAPSSGTVHALGLAWRIRWEPGVVAAVKDLCAAGVDIRWATTWSGYTAALEAALGLPALPVAFALGEDHSGVAARPLKLAAALDVVRSGERLIWTDDEVIPENGAAREELDAAGALLIAPRPSRGLRPEHIEEIRRFAADSIRDDVSR